MQSGSTVLRLIVGGMTPSFTASAVIAASSAPVAPMQWPCIAFVALTATRAATSSPSAILSIRTSLRSPVWLPPPWALTWSTSAASRPASSSAIRTARAWLAASGSVMWWPSALAP